MEHDKLLNLLQRAILIKEKAYAPYSNFKVGASLLTKDGTIFEGANIENVSYSVTICAERTCISQAVLNDLHKEAVAIAIASSSPKPCFPCGVCRQFMLELLNPNLSLIAGNLDQYKVVTIKELLPFSFDQDTFYAN